MNPSFPDMNSSACSFDIVTTDDTALVSNSDHHRSYHHYSNLHNSSSSSVLSNHGGTTNNKANIPTVSKMKRNGLQQFLLLVILALFYLGMTMKSMHSSPSYLSSSYRSMVSSTSFVSSTIRDSNHLIFKDFEYPEDDDQLDRMDGLQRDQVQHIVSHLHDDSRNILLWFGPQNINLHQLNSSEHDRFERILCYWHSIVTTSFSDGKVVAIVESDKNDTDAVVYYNRIQEQHSNLYIHTIHHTIRQGRDHDNNLQKDLEYYVHHPKEWSRQLSILSRNSHIKKAIVPNDLTMLDTTIFNVIVIDQPYRQTSSISATMPTPLTAGTFQSIYTTHQIVENSFQLMQQQQQQRPIHVFVVMDPYEDLSTVPPSKTGTNAVKVFADLVFDRTPIRTIPPTAILSDHSSQQLPKTTQKDMTNRHDVAHYLFYHNDHVMIQSKPESVKSYNEKLESETIVESKVTQKELSDIILNQHRNFDIRAAKSFLPRPKETPLTLMHSAGSAAASAEASELSNSFLMIDEPIFIHHKNQRSKPIMAIITSALSTKEDITTNDVYQTFLYKHLISSIINTVSDIEQEYWTIQLYVAIDDTDAYWIEHWHDIDNIPAWLQLSFALFPDRGSHIPFNEIALTAYHAGADYFCRVNDDSEFLTKQWITMGVQVLLQQYDPPNIGVVGPRCNEGNTKIMTHDMVHRTHLEIFGGYYYPAVFGNWYLDDWITNVYSHKIVGMDRSTVIQNWIVKHWIAKTRYEIDMKGKKLLPQEYQRGRQSIYDYLVEHYPQSTAVLEAIKNKLPPKI